MEPYRTLYPEAADRLPVTEQVSRRVLQLPTGTTVGSGEIAAIGSILNIAVDQAAKVRRLVGKETGEAEPPSIPREPDL
jgi:hypothetical protein